MTVPVGEWSRLRRRKGREEEEEEDEESSSFTDVNCVGVGDRTAGPAMVREGCTVTEGIQLAALLLSSQAPPPLLTSG